ncbi:uncharacterized protein IWZ02DRAFT_41376 [Phyllosticta citriasiana]|uniref:Uncharacterized protein n=1 Tax=Phyllosticta citriasiana TaxID=595635 RepID=A0ABR1KEX4_9PEZI
MARHRRRCSQDPCSPYYRRILVSSVRSRRLDAATGQRARCLVSEPRSSPPTFQSGTREREAGVNVHSLISSRHTVCARPRRPVDTVHSHSNPPIKRTPIFQSCNGSSKDPSKNSYPDLLHKLLHLLDGKAPAAENQTSDLLALTNPSRPEKLAVHTAGIGGQVPDDFKDAPNTNTTPHPSSIHPNLPIGDVHELMPMLGDNLQDLAPHEPPAPRYTNFFHHRCGRLFLNLDEIGQRDSRGNRIYLYRYVPADRQDDAYRIIGPSIGRDGIPFHGRYGRGSSICSECCSGFDPSESDESGKPVIDLPPDSWEGETLVFDAPGEALEGAKRLQDPLEKMEPMLFQNSIQVYSGFLRTILQHIRPRRWRRRTASEPEPGRQPFPNFDPNLIPQTTDHPDYVYPMTGLPTYPRQDNRQRNRSVAAVPERG